MRHLALIFLVDNKVDIAALTGECHPNLFWHSSFILAFMSLISCTSSPFQCSINAPRARAPDVKSVSNFQGIDLYFHAAPGGELLRGEECTSDHERTQ